MAQIKHRPLDNTKNVSLFMQNIIGVDPTASEASANACIQIRDAKNLLSQYFPYGTAKSNEYRHPKYYGEPERDKLREIIIKELVGKRRLKNDNDIRLGTGGLLPPGGLRFQKKLFLITGLPASGKSGVAERVADITKSILIDNDYAKRKFPEFNSHYGASLVHDEAALVCEGSFADPKYKGLNVIDLAVLAGANIVFPKICPTGDRIEEVLKFFANNSDNKYKCFLIHVQLSREEATIREIGRAHV